MNRDKLHPSARARYDAHDNPGTWTDESWDASNRGEGGRAVHYSEPIQNPFFPHLMDGIHIEILSYDDVAGGRPLVICQASRPEKKRTQFNMTRRYKTWRGALVGAKAWLRRAHKFMQEDVSE